MPIIGSGNSINELFQAQIEKIVYHGKPRRACNWIWFWKRKDALRDKQDAQSLLFKI